MPEPSSPPPPQPAAPVSQATPPTVDLAEVRKAELRAIIKRRKAARADRSLVGEVAALEAALGELDAGVPIYRSSLGHDERAALRPFFLLTNKPVLAVVNLGDDQVADAFTDELSARREGQHTVMRAVKRAVLPSE